MEEWANNFGTTWSIVELTGERMQLIGDLRSWSPTDIEVCDLHFLKISEDRRVNVNRSKNLIHHRKKQSKILGIPKSLENLKKSAQNLRNPEGNTENLRKLKSLKTSPSKVKFPETQARQILRIV